MKKLYFVITLSLSLLSNITLFASSDNTYMDKSGESAETMSGEFIAKEGSTIIGILNLQSDGNCNLRYIDDTNRWRSYSGTYQILGSSVYKGMSTRVLFNFPEIGPSDISGSMWWAMTESKPSVSLADMIFTLN